MSRMNYDNEKRHVVGRNPSFVIGSRLCCSVTAFLVHKAIQHDSHHPTPQSNLAFTLNSFNMVLLFLESFSNTFRVVFVPVLSKRRHA
jgi:hypothetical protein